MTRLMLLLGLLLATLLGEGCARPPPVAQKPPILRYPVTTRSEVADDYFGTKVADPYRWLEDTEAPETRAWITEQNLLTRGWLDAIPARTTLRKRLEQLKNYTRYSAPSKRGGLYFYTRNDGLQNQDVLLVSDALDHPPRVLLDPNTLSTDGTVSLAGLRISDDGRYLAYGLSDGGSDWSTWRVREVATGTDLPDVLKWIKFDGPAWTHDNAGFYYSRYPEPTRALQQVNENNALYYHRLGSAQSDDALVYARPDHPMWDFSADVTEDGDTLLIYASEGTEPKNRLYIKDLRDPKAPVLPLLEDYDAQYIALGNTGTRFLFYTNLDAPKGKVIAIDTATPARERWTTVIPEGQDTLDNASWVGDRLITTSLRDAHSVVRVYGLDGTPQTDVELPGLGTVNGFGGKQSDTETFYGFASFTQPNTLYRYDVATGQSSVWQAPTLNFDPSAYETEQVFYPSKDGTKIPMFLVHKKALVKDGRTPTFLYGYGGFDISLTPTFSENTIAWLEQGGIYASANLRGGGEYGEAWHEAGTQAHKQNVFDDFIAAAEWLIDQGYTSKARLAIHGRSNGGLLVGAALTQRPDLFGAALPGVGVLDMLRYQKFTVGAAWVSDYGSSDDAAMFPVLFKYSPVHNTRPGTAYPPTLITTGDHDDRVVPGHSFKFAAALQAAQAGSAPILIRVETRAGHGAATPTAMKLDLVADQYAFLVRALGMEGEG